MDQHQLYLGSHRFGAHCGIRCATEVDDQFNIPAFHDLQLGFRVPGVVTDYHTITAQQSFL